MYRVGNVDGSLDDLPHPFNFFPHLYFSELGYEIGLLNDPEEQQQQNAKFVVFYKFCSDYQQFINCYLTLNYFCFKVEIITATVLDGFQNII